MEEQKEQRALNSEEQRSFLYTTETPGFRILCDLLQSEIDNTIGLLESFDLRPEQEARYLGYLRAFRRILFLLKAIPRDIQLALRQSVDPTATAALFTPGISESLDIDWPQDGDDTLLAPRIGVE